MNIYFKRLCDVDHRANLIICALNSLRQRINTERKRQMLAERNRQRAELQLKPVEGEK